MFFFLPCHSLHIRLRFNFLVLCGFGASCHGNCEIRLPVPLFPSELRISGVWRSLHIAGSKKGSLQTSSL